MKYDPRQLSNYFNRLAPRERLLLSVAVVSVVSISLYSFVWDPLQTNRQLLARRITAKEKDLGEIQKQRDTYLDLLRKLDANQAAIQRPNEDANFSLFTYLDNIIGQALGREHVTSMNPSDKNIGTEFQETMVEIRLTQINLAQLVDLLYRVEKGDHPLRFSRLTIKKRVNDIHNFDVTATVSLLKVVNS
jgi:type II secretion system (T2SS) protein M